MASPATIDFDKLLAPISDSAPAGAALRDDPADAPIYYQIKDAREAARSAERALLQAWGDEELQRSTGADRPDWQSVVRLASTVLAEKSKDLWIASWLLEGLVRLHGFAGVRDGYRLIRELCEKFWDGLHPRPDDDGVATTVSQLAGLNGEGAEGALLAPIAAIPLTTEGSLRALTGQDYADAEDIAKSTDPDVRTRRMAQGSATLEMFEAAARETPRSFFIELRDDIEAAIKEFELASAVLDAKCGRDAGGYSAAPPSSKISAALANSLSRVRTLAGEPAAAETPHIEGENSGAASGSGAIGSIRSREDAFHALMRVAEFFRRTEPHSPVSYALEQAVRWGRMPLPDLIRDLVTDSSVRREFFRRTGMPLDTESE